MLRKTDDEIQSSSINVHEDHWALLAGVRFYLAYVVMNAHVGLSLTPADYAPLYRFGRNLGPLAAIIGFVAISGFSIAHSVEKLQGFYGRRIGRIWPTLAVALFGYVLLLHLYGPITTTGNSRHFVPAWYGVFATLFFLNGIVVGSFLGPTWSLAVEAIYYVIAPVLAKTNTLIIACGVAVSAGLYFFSRELQFTGLPGLLYGLAAACLFWAWGLGFLLYRYYGRNDLPGIALILSGSLLLGWYNYEGGATAIFTFMVAACALIFGGRIVLGSRSRAVLIYLGDLSYPVFLLHYPLFVWLSGVIRNKDYFVFSATAVAASVICLHLIDRPGRRWLARSRFFSLPLERYALWLALALALVAMLTALLRR